jgi:hypothetical protein
MLLLGGLKLSNGCSQLLSWLLLHLLCLILCLS